MVNPWELSARKDGVIWGKLVEQFGCQQFRSQTSPSPYIAARPRATPKSRGQRASQNSPAPGLPCLSALAGLTATPRPSLVLEDTKGAVRARALRGWGSRLPLGLGRRCSRSRLRRHPLTAALSCMTRVLQHMAVELCLDMRTDGYVCVGDLLKLNIHTFAKVPLKSHAVDEIREVMDAPALQDDFFLILVDWSSHNVLAVWLGNCIYLWNARSSKVSNFTLALLKWIKMAQQMFTAMAH